MNKIHQKIELVANVLIIIVALLLGGVMVKKYFLAAPLATNRPQRIEPKIGSAMNMPEVTWSQQPKTLILALQASCHFCNDSAPFYKRVIETVKDKNVKLVAVFPSAIEESTAHLRKLGLGEIEVKQSSLDSLNVSGTPTLILTNDKGEVTNYWIGKLSPEKETEVINKLNS